MCLTISVEPCEDSVRAIAFLISSALLTVSTRVRDWLETSTLSHFQCLDVGANLDDNTSTLVTCAFCAKIGHQSNTPIGLHEVNV
jgi:hypothetical protein